jgi:hypothetical protein
MQTFLPLPNYLSSMRTLDKSRLGNQVWREGITLIRGGWSNHPASKMWKGHYYHLGLYLLAGLEVLKERGKDYPDIRGKIMNEMQKYTNTGIPPWVGDESFHLSHRSNLLRKLPEHYREFWPNDPDNLPYIWPV